MSSARTPFCGPKIAVAPSGPVSGLFTSDMMRNSHSAIRGSSADASTRASDASPAGVGGSARPALSKKCEPKGFEQPAAAVVGAAAAQPDHEAAHARIEQRGNHVADAARGAVLDRCRHGGCIGDTDHLRHLHHRSEPVRVRNEAVGSRDLRAVRATHLDGIALRGIADRREDRVERALAAIGHRPQAQLERRDRAREAASQRRADLGRAQRALEGIGCEDDTQHKEVRSRYRVRGDRRHPPQGRPKADAPSGGGRRRRLRGDHHPPQGRPKAGAPSGGGRRRRLRGDHRLRAPTGRAPLATARRPAPTR